MEQDQQVRVLELVEEWEDKQDQDAAVWAVLLLQDQVAIASVPVAATRRHMQLGNRAIKCSVPSVVWV